MSIKISELPSASSVTSSDAIPIVQSGTTKKVTVGTMMPTIATSITSSSTNDEVAGAKAVYDYATPKDTGWLDMTQYVNTTYFSARSDVPPMARRIGNYVYWTGDVYCTVAPGGKSGDILLGFPTWLKGIGEPQYSNCGVTYDDGVPYNIFTVYSNSLQNTRIRVNVATNIVAQNQTRGFQLSNLWGYLTDTPFPTASESNSTRSLNLTKGTNTGSLVGMGDRAEITLEKEEQPEEITETKSAEVDKLESKEGSGDSR